MESLFEDSSPSGKTSCLICGDLATGYNYCQLTCEPCKVFFHRYSLKSYKFTCKKNNNCLITIANRIKCKACRLKKCFDNGMIRSVVRSNHKSTSFASVDSTNIFKNNNNNSLSFTSNKFSDFLEHLFTNVPQFLISPCSGLSSMSGSFSSKNFILSDFELTKIEEIQDAQRVIVDEQKLPVVAQSNNFYDCFISGEIYARMYIKFCKRMAHFAMLSNEDQMKILKPFCFDICLIRMAYNSNLDTGEWPSLLDENATTVFLASFSMESMSQVAKYHHEKFAENHKFIRLLQTELERDPNIRDLLIALALFRNYTLISCSEFIQYNFVFYSRLLQKYLEQKYASKTQAKKKLDILVQMMSHFDRIRTNERYIVTQLDLERVSEVYHEIFELK